MTQQEINDIKQTIDELSQECIVAVQDVLRKRTLTVGHVDHIIDNLMATFVGNSLMNIAIDKQIEYLKDRLEELSTKLSHVCTTVHKLKCDNCNHEMKPENVTIH